MNSKRRARQLFAAGLFLFAAQAALADPLIISEFRLRGPNGANDEFVEIYNATASTHTVASSSGTGYGLAASDGTVRFTIPNGTVIPAHGHYLGVNSVGYSLGNYPAGNGTTATGDVTYTTDIPDNAGIALFTTDVAANLSLATRMDAVGSTSESNTLYREGTGYPALTPFSIDYVFYRDQCGKNGSITAAGTCPNSAVKDSNDNVSDFVFVDTNGTAAGAGQRLGAPGPQNLSSPINNGTADTVTSLDSCAAATAAPNQVRDFTSDPANNSTFGTLDLRFTYTNHSGGNLTRLRFRVVDLTTFPAPSGFADLRPRTSTATSATVGNLPCGSGTTSTTVLGTTLEQPPSQPNGSGFNGTLSVNSISLATPLADGASVQVRMLNGIQQTGTFRVGLVPEGLSQSGAGTSNGVIEFACTTDAGCAPPSVVVIERANPNPTNAATVTYTVVFSEAVTGVDATDFALATSGLSGSSIASVSGSGTSYTVTVNTGTGSGTLGLNLVDNDSILGGGSTLGGNGAGNGNFTGEVYTVDNVAPTVTVNQAAAQADPTTTLPVNFTVTFSEAVTGFGDADVVIGGSAGATTAAVTGGPTVYNVAVSGATQSGTITVDVPANVAVDATNNPNTASTSTDNSVTFAIVVPSVTVNQAAGQADPTGASPVNFTVTFSEAVTGFDSNDVVIGGSAGATTAAVTGGPTLYNVAVSGATQNGTITASVPANVAVDADNHPNTASTSTDNSVTFAFVVPSVTVNQAAGQADPTSASPVNFTVTFSQAVTGFDSNDVVIGGTAGATTAVVTGGPTVYNVAVSGAAHNGTITVSVPANVAVDADNQPNTASTSTDNSVTFTTGTTAAPAALPTLSLGSILLMALAVLALAWEARRRSAR